MPSNNLGSHLPILEKDLAVQRQDAGALLAGVSWVPKVQIADLNGGAKEFQAGKKTWRPALNTASPQAEQLSLLKIARALSQDANLMSEDANSVLLALREAICIGMYLCQQYYKAAGILELSSANKAGQLSGVQKAEFAQKQNTASAVAVFCMAAYVTWKLGLYKQDKVSTLSVDFYGVPELDLTQPISAMKCCMFYLAAYLDPDRARLVHTDLEMVRMAIRYCEAVLEEIKTREPSLRFAEPFANVSYQLDGTDFVVAGFDVLRHTVAVSAEFKHVDFSEIVGNQAGKHAARRLASRLACYDVKRKKNPFSELGGMQSVIMGFGKPGTGKTMLISATATEIERLCKAIGLPFLFWPMPDNVVSTFQGGSAERMADWMKRFEDPDKVVYGTIDDGENNLEERTRQNVSAGVREVIGVFLRGTEGASAIWQSRGNGALGVYTNIPEQIDRAVLSRVQARFPIEGAVTEHDCVDQDYLWWGKLAKIDPRFVSMKDPRGYKYMADQALLHSMVDASQPVKELTDERLREVYHKVRERYEVTDHEFFAALFVGVMGIFPIFSSRDIRNIQTAVQGRIIDFDLPDEWLEHPELFYQQPYERKVEMLKDLMRSNMQRLSFAEIRHEETLRYLNALAQIASADRERRIAQLLEAADVEQAVRSRLKLAPKGQ
jgi:hypothetical protein